MSNYLGEARNGIGGSRVPAFVTPALLPFIHTSNLLPCSENKSHALAGARVFLETVNRIL